LIHFKILQSFRLIFAIIVFFKRNAVFRFPGCEKIAAQIAVFNPRSALLFNSNGDFAIAMNIASLNGRLAFAVNRDARILVIIDIAAFNERAPLILQNEARILSVVNGTPAENGICVL
jgi:hypothetical protein